jgi:hypothetical protein
MLPHFKIFFKINKIGTFLWVIRKIEVRNKIVYICMMFYRWRYGVACIFEALKDASILAAFVVACCFGKEI